MRVNVVMADAPEARINKVPTMKCALNNRPTPRPLRKQADRQSDRPDEVSALKEIQLRHPEFRPTQFQRRR